MISEAEFNKALEKNTRKFSREKVEKLRIGMDQLANLIFDDWLEKKNNKLNQVKKL